MVGREGYCDIKEECALRTNQKDPSGSNTLKPSQLKIWKVLSPAFLYSTGKYQIDFQHPVFVIILGVEVKNR